MRFSAPVLAAFAASASATTAPIQRTTTFTLEVAPGEVIEVTEDEKFALIDVSIAVYTQGTVAAVC
jgi:bacterial leucyl aminopeptidase